MTLADLLSLSLCTVDNRKPAVEASTVMTRTRSIATATLLAGLALGVIWLSRSERPEALLSVVESERQPVKSEAENPISVESAFDATARSMLEVPPPAAVSGGEAPDTPRSEEDAIRGHRIQKFLTDYVANPTPGKAHGVVCLSIATLIEKQHMGTTRKLKGAESMRIHRKDSDPWCFLINDQVYEFETGAFPVYEQLVPQLDEPRIELKVDDAVAFHDRVLETASQALQCVGQ